MTTPTYTSSTIAMTSILMFPVMRTILMVVPQLPPCVDQEAVINQLIWQVYFHYRDFINSV